MPKRNSYRSAKKPPHPSAKVMDVSPPGDFPKIGSTLSSYNPLLQTKQNTSHRRLGPTTTVANEKKLRRRRRIKKTLKWSAITIAVLLVITGGYVGYKFAKNSGKIFGGNILGFLQSTKLKGEDTGRVNILLAGDSADDPGHNGADLTDSIMIVSIDTNNNRAFLLSVPRDLWVNIPGYGHSKINAAYEDGQAEHFSQSGYASGGMGLLEETISQDFGINMDYYALINYTAFKDAVNAVGGISINVQSCNPSGLYDPDIDYATGGVLVNLSNGQHTLTGEQALDLARARGDAYGSYGFCQSDFTRQQNQRQMLLAVKSKATGLSVLSNPVKLGSLFDSIGNNVQTNFKTSEVRRLYDISKKITNANVISVSLNSANGKNLLQSYESEDGESALIPAAGYDNFSSIQAYVQQLTTPPTTTTITK